MLPTKGYFQDIECPFFNTTCGRPYCHFRHKRKPNEIVEEPVENSSNNTVPTYKPTPKSELAKNHIPISYVPDLAYNRERTVRPIRTEKPTYKPTPLSILSSVNNPTNDNHEHRETIKDIENNIASNVYDPFKSEINFEDLSTEFELIDGIINESPEEEPQDVINDNIEQLNSDIEKEQNKLNLLKSEIKNKDDDESTKQDKSKIKSKDNKVTAKLDETKDQAKDIKKEKLSRDKCRKHKDKDEKNNKDKTKTSDKSKHKSSKDQQEKDSKKTSSKSHKSSEREKHRKEDKKNSDKRKSSKSRDRSKSPKPKEKKNDKKQSRDRSKSPKEKKDDKKQRIDSNSSHSSPERHRKKTDNSESKKSSSKEKDSKKEKSGSPSREKQSKNKSKKRSRSPSKDDDKNRSKSSKTEKEKSSKSKDKTKSSSSSNSKKSSKDKRKKSTSESNYSVSDHDNEPRASPAAEIIPSDVDMDYEDEDETMRECYKIFNEYKPEAIEPQLKEEHKDLFEDEPNSIQSKKRKAHAGAEAATMYSKPSVAPPKPSLLPGQILKNRYKIAKLAQATNEQENIMNEIKSITAPKPKSLLEAARQYKMKRLEHEKALEQQKRPKTSNVVDDILNGTHRPSGSGVRPLKIAAVPNVALIEKAKQRISLVKQQRIENVKTIAQTQKSGRVAHVPEYSLSDIPDVFQAEKSKLPVNVRTRFLTMLADECAKIYASKEDIYNRALNEEFACYEKCKVLATYRNSAMLAVNRLRKEHQDRESKGLGLLLFGEAVLNKKETDFQGITFYNHVKKWLLSEEDLDLHGYPKESHEKGLAVISNRVTVEDYSIDENQRRCSRCGKIYQVDDDGWPLFEDECMYHPLRKRTIRREQIFLCCKSSDDTGCVMSDTHVSDGLEKHLLEGYQTTLSPTSDNDPRSTQVFALDCEMCYTTRGLELTRVTIVDIDCKTVYESFVKPLNPIIDYNTRFSGITKDQMDRTSTSILQVQANILHLCNSETILVGHSLESDMKALKIVHGTIIDTSILFPHKMGLPHKRSLKALASEHLQKIIQNDVAGHDSAEDAVSCMELIKWKLKEELKVKSKGR